ncbi:hypothetical protein PB01_06190 [Psychrobacillus glaciei]|uniref:YhfM-like domain-containing protein n=1 Tax=Psychrobacillus glaciei TaxID=2283160 RepID=A0A5J6SKM8_9BACI|nr:hypothetical protein [Psychrobacillus glaciei]QFF98448.1 hypothetical protein PB01_06190 [Psychrobacillus glaciei]
MKKVFLLVFTSTFMLIILFGCQSKGNTTLESINNSELQFEGKRTKVNISKSKGFSANLDFFTVLEDEENFETVKRILSSSVKEEGIVDMAEPEYYLEVISEDESKEGFYLWVGEKGQRSTFMKMDNTHTIYTVSEEMTNKMIELVE